MKTKENSAQRWRPGRERNQTYVTLKKIPVLLVWGTLGLLLADKKRSGLGKPVLGAQRGCGSVASVAQVWTVHQPRPLGKARSKHTKPTTKIAQAAFPILVFLPLLTAACHLAPSLIWSTPVSSTTNYETWPWSHCVGDLWHNDQLGVRHNEEYNTWLNANEDIVHGA